MNAIDPIGESCAGVRFERVGREFMILDDVAAIPVDRFRYVGGQESKECGQKLVEGILPVLVVIGVEWCPQCQDSCRLG